MRKFILTLLVCCLIVLASVGIVSAQDGSPISISCPNGLEINNGVEIIVNMRPGFTYTATAVGVDGFDPVLAVMDRGQVRACSDDNDTAEDYTANLPTTGQVTSSGLNAQLPFSHNYNGFENISLIVGGFGGQNGEFLLILEGMSVTARDGSGAGAGDPFTIQITENIVASDTNVSVYMMATNEQLDPLMRVINADNEAVYECDDAGTSLCEESSSDLSNSYISRTLGRQTPLRTLNAMLMLPTAGATTLDLSNGFYINFLMTSYQQSSFGDYAVAFHVGIDDGTGVATTQNVQPTPQSQPTQSAGQSGGPVPGGGVSVTCPNGFQITNAVEIVVNMRPGFVYTATVLGVDGFDPVLAVLESGVVRDCNDDSSDAGAYEANLPSTGRITSSRFNSQLPFSHNNSGFTDISLIIGGYQGATGDFLLILEGMAVTSADGSGDSAGDPFGIHLTPNIVNADINATVYMIGLEASIDPLTRLVDSDAQELLSCDDAGTSLCAEGSTTLTNSFLSRSRNRTAQADNLDAMLVVPTTTLTELDFSTELFLNFLMTSFRQSTFGEYLVAFHIGISEPGVDADL